MKVLEVILEIIGWLSIIATVALAFSVISILIYIEWNIEWVAIAAFVSGVIGGGVWATHIWKKHGTINYLSKIRKIS